MRLMERGKCQGTRSYTVGVVEIENKPADRVGKATRVDRGQCAHECRVQRLEWRVRGSGMDGPFKF